MTNKVSWIETLTLNNERVMPGKANFFLLWMGLFSDVFCTFMSTQGILVRNRSGDPNLWGWVRVSVGSNLEKTQFFQALKAFREHYVVIFDLDDTVVDTSKSFDTVVKMLVEKYSDEVLSTQALQALRQGGGFNDDWDAIVELLKRRDITVTREAIAREAEALYHQIAPDAETLLIPIERLKKLKQRYRLAIATGRRVSEYQPLWSKALKPFMDTVVCQDTQPHLAQKPNPALLEVALKQLGATAGVYVGNSVDDMRAAKSAGLLAVGVTKTQDQAALQAAGATIVLDDINNLMEIL